jgi:PKD repeat protein
VNDDIKYGLTGGVYYPETINVGGTNLYGYYVTPVLTNGVPNGTLRTNRTTGIVHSLNGPQPPSVAPWLYDPGLDRAASCGICHSGPSRWAMLEDYENRLDGRTNALVFHTGKDNGSWGPTCAVCHDPHSADNKFQLRNPTWSSNYYTMPTTTDKRTIISTNFQGGKTTNIVFMGTTFASIYDPNVQVCGQCHNTRGARWDGRAYGLMTNGASITVGLTTNITGHSRPPHHSPQYNILIGIAQPDYLNTNALGVATNFTATHSGIAPRTIFNTNQCATCHMPAYKDPTTGENVTGHSYELNTKGCALGGCHTGGVPDIEGFQINTTNSISRLVDLLNQWATNKAPALLGATDYNKHKQNSWEYTTPGALASLTNAGPAATNQVKLPDDILQARFNTYMVLHDGSMGVHNPKYIPFLLKNAEAKVLNQFNVARFTANTPSVFTNTLVNFTNLSVGVASCTWDFGDGGTSTSTAGMVQHAYASAGSYTVTLTVTDINGVTETMTRNNYIIAYVKPVPNFTATPSTGPAPLTVSFANLSTDAMYYRWTFMNPTSIPNSNEPTPPPFTYTNAGTYQIKLTAYNEAGNVSITNTVIVTP